MAKLRAPIVANLETPHSSIWTFKEHQNSTQQLQNSEEKQQENYAKIKWLAHIHSQRL